MEVSKLKKKSELRYLLAGLLVIALLVLAGCTADTSAGKSGHETTAAKEEKPEGPEAGEVKLKLISGNARFVSGKLASKDLGQAKREDLFKNGQKPYAIVVACSDSRVAPELVLDQGLGEIFVIRTAGNVVDPIAIGSIEYAVEHLHVPYLMVMGHEKCGAVTAAVEAGDKVVEGNVGAIIEKIKPSVLKAKAAGASGLDLVEKSTEENVKAVVEELETKSPVIKEALEKGELTVVGSKYDLDKGKFSWVR